MARRTDSKKRKSDNQKAVEETPSLWDRVPPAGQHAVCLVSLVILSISFFSQIHFGGMGFAATDTVNWRASAQSVITYEEETGEYALWATHMFAGMPAFMISYRLAVPQVDSVLRTARKVLWPSSHLIALLAGMYLLVWYLTRNKLAGVISAVLFGLTTYIPILLVAGHNSKFVALSLAPWLLLGLAYVFRKPGLLSSLLFAVALAANLRAGHFQITYYVLFAGGIWWIAEGLAAARENRLALFGRTTGLLIMSGVLAGLMVAQPYLAQFEYKAFTVRGAGPGGAAGGMAWDYAMGWSQGIGELLTLIIADAYGGSEAYWGPKIFTAGPHYITGVGFLLAVVGVARGRNATARGLGVAAALMILFSLGENLEPLNRLMFNYFPLFSSFRVPETWLAAVALVTAVLAGLGVDYLVRARPEVRSRRSPVVVAYLGFLAVILVLLVGRDSLLSFSKDGEEAMLAQQIARSNGVPVTDPRVSQTAERVVADLRAERSDRFRDDAGRTLIFLLLAGGFFLLFLRGRVSGPGLQAVLALLVLIDLWGVDRRYLNEERMVRSTDIERAIPEYAFDRFIVDQRLESAPFRVLSLEGAPTGNARPSYYYESLSGYHGAKLRSYQDFLDHLLIRPSGELNTAVLSMLNTRYVVSRAPVPQSDPVFEDPQTGFTVYELRDVQPRAYLVDSTVVATTPEETWELMNDRSFDPSAVGIVDEALPILPAPDDSSNASEAVVESYSPRRITVNASSDAARLLVLSEMYYPSGWTATVDGTPTDIVRVNYLLRGVVLPPGQHEVRFEFAPKAHTVGIWATATSTAVVYLSILVLLALEWKRRKGGRMQQELHADH